MEKLLQWMAVQVVAGAPSVEVAADAYPAIIKTQRQMTGQMTSSVWHPLTQWYRRCQSDARIEYADCGGENWRLLTWTWPGSLSQKVAGMDKGYPILASFKRLFLL